MSQQDQNSVAPGAEGARKAAIEQWEFSELKTEVQYLRQEHVELKSRLMKLETDVRLLDRSERSTIPPAPKGIRSIVPTVQRNAPQLTAGTIAATVVVILDQLISLWMAKGH